MTASCSANRGSREGNPVQAFKECATTMGDECSPVGVLLIRTSKRTAAAMR